MLSAVKLAYAAFVTLLLIAGAAVLLLPETYTTIGLLTTVHQTLLTSQFYRNTSDLDLSVKSKSSDLDEVSQYTRPLLIATTKGRYGNQLFEYAAVYAIAKRTGHQPAIKSNSVLLTYFKGITAVRVNISTDMYEKMLMIPEGDVGVYNDDLIDSIPHDRHVRVHGGFQSWKYFTGYNNQVRHQLQFHDSISSETQRTLRRMMENHLQKVRTNRTYQQHYNMARLTSTQHFTYIGIHVRRGDFTKESFVKKGFGAAPISYILKAMTYYRQRYPNPVFIVASNGPDWCETHIPQHPHHDVLFLTGNRPMQRRIYDFASLVYCNHSIITAGTFSWWIGWLTGGEVVYYSGYPIPNTTLDKRKNHQDYYPAHWIPMQ